MGKIARERRYGYHSLTIGKKVLVTNVYYGDYVGTVTALTKTTATVEGTAMIGNTPTTITTKFGVSGRYDIFEKYGGKYGCPRMIDTIGRNGTDPETLIKK
jgi:hypothetical protein